MHNHLNKNQDHKVYSQIQIVQTARSGLRQMWQVVLYPQMTAKLFPLSEMAQYHKIRFSYDFQESFRPVLYASLFLTQNHPLAKTLEH